MPQYSVEERERLTARAVDLRAKGKTYGEIAEELVINRKTARKYVEAEYARRQEHRSTGDAREAAIARYDMLFRECMDRLEALGKDSRSLNASGYINSARACQERMDKLTGTEAPTKVQHMDQDEWEVVWSDIDPSETLRGS